MAKKGMFSDPIAPTQRKSSKNFKAPTKEEATTGDYMAAGDNYGTGFRAKVGTTRHSATSPIPPKSKKWESPRSLA